MVSKQTFKQTVNKVNNFLFDEKEVFINGQLNACYMVQNRRGMNRRLAYQQGNLKNLRKSALDYQTKKTKKEDKAARDSDEDIPKDDAENSDQDTHSLNSGQSSRGSIARSEQMINANDSYSDSLNGSDDEVIFSKRNFSDVQDDRAIVKIAAINDKFKLVERPRFLINFEMTTWESKFATSTFGKHFKTEICTFITKGVLDFLLAEAVAFSVHGNDKKWIYVLITLAWAIYFSLSLAFLFCRKRRKPRCVPIQILTFVSSFVQMILIGPLV
mmetsp:Transcript_13554/g.17164  ORF Transcript_13554/g.17164 Transcript_13554/m.17164 type:complete len:272 (-) Transcript_13554:151-966(-)